jgi:predicted NBD/HSP70 family sugar kinase
MMGQPRIGIDLGGTKIEGVILDDLGNVVFRQRVRTPKNDFSATTDAIAHLVQMLDREIETKGYLKGPDIRKVPIGIGTPGSISPVTGKMRNSNSTGLNDQALQERLTEQLARPVRLANDADCFALSEATDGAGQGASLVFGVILGTGTGGGIVHDQKLLQGANGISGEWGHCTLPIDAYQADEDEALPLPQSGQRLCYCGRTDCVETWVSGTGFENTFRLASGQSLTGEEIADLLESTDVNLAATAHQVLQQYCNLLALALSTVINTLDPHIIVLGGGMSNIEKIYPEVTKYLSRYVFSDIVSTKLVKAGYGDSSGVRGAAWLWPAGTV